MKTRVIQREYWINSGSLLAGNEIKGLPYDPKELGYSHISIPVTVEPKYIIKLETTGHFDAKTSTHLRTGKLGANSRMHYNEFMSVLKHLKDRFPKDCKLNWNIYSGQPIWEFTVLPVDLRKAIESFNPYIEVVM